MRESVNYCSRCGGKGKTVNGKFCRCSKGQELKEKEGTGPKYPRPVETTYPPSSSREVAGKNMKEEKYDYHRKLEDFAVGDWVKPYRFNSYFDGVLCEVVAIGQDEIKVLAYGKNQTGDEIRGSVWIDPHYLQPAPVDHGNGNPKYLFEYLEILNLRKEIDRALEAGNREKFHALASML